MDSRIALLPQTVLKFEMNEGSTIQYTIIREIGRGSSCIVYEACRHATTGDKKIYRIKECYPHKLHIERDKEGMLISQTADELRFKDIKETWKLDFSVSNRLFYGEGMQGAYVDQIDLYSSNNTLYIVSAFSSEKTLLSYRPSSIKECVMFAKWMAYIINNIHSHGYLYLDAKPSNVLVVDGLEKRIQLFDFDSMVSLQSLKSNETIKCSDIRLSYSKGFAPIELQMAEIKNLGLHTDVYGVAATLYYMLFGKAPNAIDCESDAIYDFDNMRYDASLCDDKLFYALEEFFHASLANYYLDRYQSMQEVLDKLNIIEKFADTDAPRIISSKNYESANVLGREDELQQIDDFVENSSNNCLFITGIGGIGKSSLVRKYLTTRYKKFDTVLYMQFEDTMEKTISNDLNITITTMKQSDEVKTGIRYFEKKIAKIRELVAEKVALIVIDNFTGDIDRDTLCVLETNWKVIIVTRQTPKYKNCDKICVSAMPDINLIKTMFEKNLGRFMCSEDERYFANIVKKTAGHTLTLALIAKQIASSHITLIEASELTDSYGFSHIAQEKVDYEKDGLPIYNTIGGIIDELFETSQLLQHKKVIMKAMSLFSIEGIDINEFQQIFDLPSKEDINELERMGWLVVKQDNISLHPVIQEAVHRWEWDEQYKKIALQLLEHYYIEIRLEATKNNYPKKLYDKWSLMIKIKNKLKEEIVSDMKLWHNRVVKKSFEKSGLVGKVVKARWERMNNLPANIKKLESDLLKAERILAECSKKIEIKELDIYTNLLYVTVLYMPRYKEANIISEVNNILDNYTEDFVTNGYIELLKDSEKSNPVTILELYHLMASIYADYNDGDSIAKFKNLLLNAERIAKVVNQPQVYALYFDLCSGYYDVLLNGAYDATTTLEQELCDKLLLYVEKTLKYSKKTIQADINHLYIKNTLVKATIMMRSGRGKKSEISKLIDNAKDLIVKYTLPYADVRHQYYLVCGWYYTIMLDSVELTEIAINKARELSSKISKTDLDEIDNTIVPCANMYLQLKCCDKAEMLLNEGMDICERHETADAYINKKKQLIEYLEDVSKLASFDS